MRSLINVWITQWMTAGEKAVCVVSIVFVDIGVMQHVINVVKDGFYEEQKVMLFGL